LERGDGGHNVYSPSLTTVGVGIRAFDGYVHEMRDFSVKTHL